jgi:hypothetical protein
MSSSFLVCLLGIVAAILGPVIVLVGMVIVDAARDKCKPSK